MSENGLRTSTFLKPIFKNTKDKSADIEKNKKKTK